MSTQLQYQLLAQVIDSQVIDLHITESQVTYVACHPTQVNRPTFTPANKLVLDTWLGGVVVRASDL